VFKTAEVLSTNRFWDLQFCQRCAGLSSSGRSSQQALDSNLNRSLWSTPATAELQTLWPSSTDRRQLHRGTQICTAAACDSPDEKYVTIWKPHFQQSHSKITQRTPIWPTGSVRKDILLKAFLLKHPYNKSSHIVDFTSVGGTTGVPSPNLFNLISEAAILLVTEKCQNVEHTQNTSQWPAFSWHWFYDRIKLWSTVLTSEISIEKLKVMAVGKDSV